MKLTPGRLIINRMKMCCWIFFREKGICKAGNCEDKILCYKTFLMLSFCLSNLSNKTVRLWLIQSKSTHILHNLLVKCLPKLGLQYVTIITKPGNLSQQNNVTLVHNANCLTSYFHLKIFKSGLHFKTLVIHVLRLRISGHIVDHTKKKSKIILHVKLHDRRDFPNFFLSPLQFIHQFTIFSKLTLF